MKEGRREKKGREGRMAQPSPVAGLEADGMMVEGERKRGREMGERE